MNVIQWKPKAARQLRKLQPEEQIIVYQAVDGLSKMPDCQDKKASKP